MTDATFESISPKFIKDIESNEIVVSTANLGGIETKSGVVSLNLSLIKDKDGKQIYVSRLTEADSKKYLKNFGDDLVLTVDQRIRFAQGLEKKLPFLVCANLLNRPNIDIRDFNGHEKTLVGFDTEPGVGKTSLLGAINLIKRYPVVDVDRFTRRNIKGYTSGLGWLGSPDKNPPDMADFFENVKKVRTKPTSLIEGNLIVASQSLDLVTSLVLTGGRSIILFDTPGYRDTVRPVPDIFDYIASEGLDGKFKLPERFSKESIWKFAQEFPNPDFVKFVRERQEVVSKVREQVLKSLTSN